MRNSLARTNNNLRTLGDFFFGNGFLDDYRFTDDSWTPSVDIVEKKDKFLIKADLPGVEEKDINLELKDGVLTLKGERNQETKEEGENYCRCERSFGSFSRSFNVRDVDETKINASFKNGSLTIELPKAKELEPKKIDIKAA